MDAGTLALINSGVTTLLGLMITDAWGRTKRVAAKLFSRDGSAQSYVESELDETRDVLLNALESGDATSKAEVEAEWRARLRRAVAKDPSLLDLLNDFVQKNGEAATEFEGAVRAINMHANAHDHSRIYQQGQGVQHN